MKHILFLILAAFFGLSLSGLSVADAKKIDSIEKSNLYYFNGVYVLDLHGSREEMMFAHGYFASKNVKALSPIEYFSSAMEKALKEKVGTIGNRFIGGTLRALLKIKMGAEDEKAYKSFALGYNQPVEKIYRAVMYPDFGEMLASVNYSNNKTGSNMPDLGCSTFVAPKSDLNPGLLFGRNLEFGGVGVFDRYPAIIYLNSTDSKDIPYIQMTSLGLPGTHTAYNKSGIMVSLHQLTLSQINPIGDLILNVVDEVARRAHSLEEARAIIESKSFTTPWKIIVASETQNAAFVAEVTPKGKYISSASAIGIGESNHVTEVSLKPSEFFSSYNYLKSSIGRKKTMSMALSSGAVIDADSAVNLLGSRSNPETGRNSFVSMSKFSNIMSVVLATKEHEIYFGVANRINTKPSSGSYIRFPLGFETNFDSFEPEIHYSSASYPEAVSEVDSQIRAAMVSNYMSGDITLVAEHLKKAIGYFSTDVDLNNVYAAILLKLYGIESGKSDIHLAEAIAVLARNKSIIHSENQVAVHQVLSARVAILQSKPENARSIYESIVPTTEHMKVAIAADMRALKSNNSRAKLIESLSKMKFTLSELDILNF